MHRSKGLMIVSGGLTMCKMFFLVGAGMGERFTIFEIAMELVTDM